MLILVLKGKCYNHKMPQVICIVVRDSNRVLIAINIFLSKFVLEGFYKSILNELAIVKRKYPR